MSLDRSPSASMGRGLVSVWVERLSWAALPFLMATRLRHGRFALSYINAARGGVTLGRWLWNARVLTSPPRRVPYTRHGERVDDPSSAALSIHARQNALTEQCFARYHTAWSVATYPDPRVRWDRVYASLRGMLAQELYHLLVLLELARYRHAQEGVVVRRLVILSPNALLVGTLPSGWAGDGVEFHSPWSWRHSRLMWIGRSLLRLMAGIVRPRQRVSPGPAIIATVARFAGLDRWVSLNDVHWWWESGIPAERIILCFERADQPATREVVAEAQRLGIQCVVMETRAAGDAPHLLWQGAPDPRMALVRFGRQLRAAWWGCGQGAMGRWSACRFVELLYRSAPWEDFLTAFNVRALFHYLDTGADYISLACDAAGAARVVDQWSNYPWPSSLNVRLSHVCFAWGRRSVDFMQMIPDTCVDQIVITGCILRGVGPHGPEADKPLRRAVTAHGATRVLALFDTSLPCEGFYGFFLRKAIEDPRWGLLIKPKASVLPWNGPHCPDLQQLYERACETGRVRVLDARLSPVEAAAEADLAVGVGVNSAAVVTALAGHRAIHLDYVRLHATPSLSACAEFYQAGPNRLVFDDPATLWRALNGYYDDPQTWGMLGLAADGLLQAIDPFRDGRASERIGTYLRWYLEGLDHEWGRDAALQAANQRYTQTWGRGLVVAKGRESSTYARA